MKSSIYAFTFLLLGILSCDDRPVELNFISAKLNGVNWNGNLEIKLDSQSDTLTFLGSCNKEHLVEEHFVFKFKFRGKGVYNESELKIWYHTTIGGDVISSEYVPDKSKSSNVTITEYDSERNSLQGTFEISLLREWSNPKNNIDVLSFTNGQFGGSIENSN